MIVFFDKRQRSRSHVIKIQFFDFGNSVFEEKRVWRQED